MLDLRILLIGRFMVYSLFPTLGLWSRVGFVGLLWRKTVTCQLVRGIALRTPRSMQEGEIVGVVFAISNSGPLMIAEGTVIWDDKQGKTGLHLRFASPQDRDRISEWLDSEFYIGSKHC